MSFCDVFECVPFIGALATNFVMILNDNCCTKGLLVAGGGEYDIARHKGKNPTFYCKLDYDSTLFFHPAALRLSNKLVCLNIKLMKTYIQLTLGTQSDCVRPLL